jgi:hypothetical protein
LLRLRRPRRDVIGYRGGAYGDGKTAGRIAIPPDLKLRVTAKTARRTSKGRMFGQRPYVRVRLEPSGTAHAAFGGGCARQMTGDARAARCYDYPLVEYNFAL